jgi:1-acyl-sn-glycerol-3-phosphate acyltransferase
VRRVAKALVTIVLYHQMLFWGLLVFVGHMLTRPFTFPWDPGRRVPHAVASFFWGRAFFGTHPFWRVKVEGVENAGPGPYLVICNHQSLVDSLAMLMIGHRIKFISHIKVFTAPLLGSSMRICGYIGVEPGNPFPAPRVAREINDWWALGESVCLYPEGTRSGDGEIQPFKAGGFRLAHGAKVSILPVAIDGTHEALPKGAKTYVGSPFKRIRVHVLPPIPWDACGNDPRALAHLTHDTIATELDRMRGRALTDSSSETLPTPPPKRVASA